MHRANARIRLAGKSLNTLRRSVFFTRPLAHQKKPYGNVRLFLVCRKPLARRVVPKKAAADDVDIKTPFARIKMQSANCTKQAKGGHSK